MLLFLSKELHQAFTVTFFLFSNKSLIDVSRVVSLKTGLCGSHRGSSFIEFGPIEMEKNCFFF